MKQFLNELLGAVIFASCVIVPVALYMTGVL